jgi:hypothetical protein
VNDVRRRPGLTARLVAVAAALAVAMLLRDRYGLHAVDLFVALPDADRGTGLELRVSRPDGQFVASVEQDTRGASGHSLLVHAHLPRGPLHVDAWVLPGRRAFVGDVRYDGEEALDVALRPR